MTCLRHVRAAMTEPQREPSEPLDPKAATNRQFTKKLQHTAMQSGCFFTEAVI